MKPKIRKEKYKKTFKSKLSEASIAIWIKFLVAVTSLIDAASFRILTARCIWLVTRFKTNLVRARSISERWSNPALSSMTYCASRIVEHRPYNYSLLSCVPTCIIIFNASPLSLNIICWLLSNFHLYFCLFPCYLNFITFEYQNFDCRADYKIMLTLGLNNYVDSRNYSILFISIIKSPVNFCFNYFKSNNYRDF